MPGLPAGHIKQSLTSSSLPEELLLVQSIGAFSSLARPGFVGGNEK
jgi:hypothetical protein